MAIVVVSLWAWKTNSISWILSDSSRQGNIFLAPTNKTLVYLGQTILEGGHFIVYNHFFWVTVPLLHCAPQRSNEGSGFTADSDEVKSLLAPAFGILEIGLYKSLILENCKRFKTPKTVFS